MRGNERQRRLQSKAKEKTEYDESESRSRLDGQGLYSIREQNASTSNKLQTQPASDFVHRRLIDLFLRDAQALRNFQ
jgi:hypothetical protein